MAVNLITAQAKWVATVDPDSFDIYYVNTQTEEVSWDRPKEFNGPLVCKVYTRLLTVSDFLS